MLNKEDKRVIQISRKYNLTPENTIKCEAFALFDEGYSPKEVRFILRFLKDTYDKPKTFTDTIRRYYYDWKKAQSRKT